VQHRINILHDLSLASLELLGRQRRRRSRPVLPNAKIRSRIYLETGYHHRSRLPHLDAGQPTDQLA
jgi:hypothetical protein